MLKLLFISLEINFVGNLNIKRLKSVSLKGEKLISLLKEGAEDFKRFNLIL